MGISSLPSPSEGVLSIILINTALSITILKSIVRSIFNAIGIHPAPQSSSQSEAVEISSDRTDLPILPVEFQSRFPAVRFGSLARCPAEHDCECSVCLTRFEPESEINRLPCEHFFHKDCLEKWLEYQHVTCPLCRSPLPQEEEASCPWF
ncbi:probable E3 ubiquitin-protein ligase XERICO [Magnolia sinica]|uniref:probable E3 ubiquitin-protein ligase XERICO n=1 Tax=Magnolia sinica TaxID=86752 RepID=UPI00265B16F1|nr:probable E3 ubiquitin-protein ligase XERICO [Magnolia sinica]